MEVEVKQQIRRRVVETLALQAVVVVVVELRKRNGSAATAYATAKTTGRHDPAIGSRTMHWLPLPMQLLWALSK